MFPHYVVVASWRLSTSCSSFQISRWMNDTKVLAFWLNSPPAVLRLIKYHDWQPEYRKNKKKGSSLSFHGDAEYLNLKSFLAPRR